MNPVDRRSSLRLPVRFRRAAAPLWLLIVLASGPISLVGCASKVGPDDPAYDSEQPSNPVDEEQEREWEERDEDL